MHEQGGNYREGIPYLLYFLSGKFFESLGHDID
jgi:hypothetical protein